MRRPRHLALTAELVPHLAIVLVRAARTSRCGSAPRTSTSTARIVRRSFASTPRSRSVSRGSSADEIHRDLERRVDATRSAASSAARKRIAAILAHVAARANRARTATHATRDDDEHGRDAGHAARRSDVLRAARPPRRRVPPSAERREDEHRRRRAARRARTRAAPPTACTAATAAIAPPRAAAT